MSRAIALCGVPSTGPRRRRIDPVVALGVAINVGIYALLAASIVAVLVP